MFGIAVRMPSIPFKRLEMFTNATCSRCDVAGTFGEELKL